MPDLDAAAGGDPKPVDELEAIEEDVDAVPAEHDALPSLNVGDMAALLSDSSGMMDYLCQTLKALEAASGEEDAEARELLAKLKIQTSGGSAKTSAEGAASAAASAPSAGAGPAAAARATREVMSQLDQVEAALNSIEGQIDAAAPGTKALLNNAVREWSAPEGTPSHKQGGEGSSKA